jgi:hypothetical protein
MKDKEAIAREAVESFGGLNIPFNKGHFEVMTKRVVSALTEWEQQSPDVSSLRELMCDFVRDGEIPVNKRAEYSTKMRAIRGLAPPAEPEPPSDKVAVLGQKELLPCPFCGGKATDVDIEHRDEADGDIYFASINCINIVSCGGSVMGIGCNEEEPAKSWAINAWNKRASVSEATQPEQTEDGK